VVLSFTCCSAEALIIFRSQAFVLILNNKKVILVVASAWSWQLYL